MMDVNALWDDVRTLWVLLSLPAIALMNGALNGEPSAMLLHASGEVSARLLVLSLAMTPLRLLFSGHRWPLWLLARRRSIGVASFGYALLHVLSYGWFDGLFTDLLMPAIASGWAGFIVFVALAMTSNDTSVRRLGRWWKVVQRTVYAAAVLTAAHWFLLKYEAVPVLVHFVPLVGLQAYRVLRRRRRAGPT